MLPPLHVFLVDGLWAASFDCPSRRASLWTSFNGTGKFGRLSHQLVAANLIAGAARVVDSFITGNISSSCPRVTDSRIGCHHRSRQLAALPPRLPANGILLPRLAWLKRPFSGQELIGHHPGPWPPSAICHAQLERWASDHA